MEPVFPETKTQTRRNKKTTGQPISLMYKQQQKVLNKILANQTQQYIKKDYTPYFSAIYLRNAGLV